MAGFYELTPAQQSERVAALAWVALGSWGLEARELTLLKYRENAVFRVAAGDGRRYAIRVHRAGYHSDAELESELQWMQALATDGFDVPELVPTSKGQLFDVVSHRDVPEPRQVDLFAWIDGQPLGNVESGLQGDVETVAQTFYTIGVLAGRLHNHSERWCPPPGFTRQAWDVEGLVGEQPLWGRFWELAALSGPEHKLLIRARDRVRDELSRLPRSSRNYGLIHADFAPENLMVDGSRVRLIDFDDAGYGWHLFEIATTLYFHIGQPYFESVERAMLEGYRSERELTLADEALLPLFYAARGFTYLGWVHTRSETETARELTPMLIELACRTARRYSEEPQPPA
jgi:Ser/Thr protein kinase RdoA (MazF antagonist)